MAAGKRHIVVMGDLNEGPAVLGQPAANLAALVDPNGPLVEVYALPAFDPGPRPGTFQSYGIRHGSFYERYNCTPHRDGHRQLPGAQYKRKSNHRVRSGQLPRRVCEYQRRDADRSQW